MPMQEDLEDGLSVITCSSRTIYLIRLAPPRPGLSSALPRPASCRPFLLPSPKQGRGVGGEGAGVGGGTGTGEAGSARAADGTGVGAGAGCDEHQVR